MDMACSSILVTQILKHNNWVEYCTFSRDGQFLATCSGYEVHLWRYDGKKIAVLQHAGYVWKCGFINNTSFLYSSTGTETLCVWDISDLSLQRPLQIKESLLAAAQTKEAIMSAIASTMVHGIVEKSVEVEYLNDISKQYVTEITQSAVSSNYVKSLLKGIQTELHVKEAIFSALATLAVESVVSDEDMTLIIEEDGETTLRNKVSLISESVLRYVTQKQANHFGDSIIRNTGMDNTKFADDIASENSSLSEIIPFIADSILNYFKQSNKHKLTTADDNESGISVIISLVVKAVLSKTESNKHQESQQTQTFLTTSMDSRLSKRLSTTFENIENLYQSTDNLTHLPGTESCVLSDGDESAFITDVVLQSITEFAVKKQCVYHEVTNPSRNQSPIAAADLVKKILQGAIDKLYQTQDQTCNSSNVYTSSINTQDRLASNILGSLVNVTKESILQKSLDFMNYTEKLKHIGESSVMHDSGNFPSKCESSNFVIYDFESTSSISELSMKYDWKSVTSTSMNESSTKHDHKSLHSMSEFCMEHNSESESHISSINSELMNLSLSSSTDTSEESLLVEDEFLQDIFSVDQRSQSGGTKSDSGTSTSQSNETRKSEVNIMSNGKVESDQKKIKDYIDHTKMNWKTVFTHKSKQQGNVKKPVFILRFHKTINHSKNIVLASAAHPQGNCIAVGTLDTFVRIVSLETRSVIKILTHHKGCVEHVTFSNSGKFLATCSKDRSIWLISRLQTRERSPICLEQEPVSCQLVGIHGAWVTHCAFSPCDSMLVSSSINRSVKVWRVRTREVMHTFVDHTNAVWSCCFLQSTIDDMTVAVASVSSDKTLRVWNLLDPKLECIKFTPPGVIRNKNGSHSSSMQLLSCEHNKTANILCLASYDGQAFLTTPKFSSAAELSRKIIKRSISANVKLDFFAQVNLESVDLKIALQCARRQQTLSKLYPITEVDKEEDKAEKSADKKQGRITRTKKVLETTDTLPDMENTDSARDLKSEVDISQTELTITLKKQTAREQIENALLRLTSSHQHRLYDSFSGLLSSVQDRVNNIEQGINHVDFEQKVASDNKPHWCGCSVHQCSNCNNVTRSVHKRNFSSPLHKLPPSCHSEHVNYEREKITNILGCDKLLNLQLEDQIDIDAVHDATSLLEASGNQKTTLRNLPLTERLPIIVQHAAAVILGKPLLQTKHTAEKQVKGFTTTPLKDALIGETKLKHLNRRLNYARNLDEHNSSTDLLLSSARSGRRSGISVPSLPASLLAHLYKKASQTLLKAATGHTAPPETAKLVITRKRQMVDDEDSEKVAISKMLIPTPTEEHGRFNMTKAWLETRKDDQTTIKPIELDKLVYSKNEEQADILTTITEECTGSSVHLGKTIRSKHFAITSSRSGQPTNNFGHAKSSIGYASESTTGSRLIQKSSRSYSSQHHIGKDGGSKIIHKSDLMVTKQNENQQYPVLQSVTNYGSLIDQCESNIAQKTDEYVAEINRVVVDIASRSYESHKLNSSHKLFRCSALHDEKERQSCTKLCTTKAKEPRSYIRHKVKDYKKDYKADMEESVSFSSPQTETRFTTKPTPTQKLDYCEKSILGYDAIKKRKVKSQIHDANSRTLVGTKAASTRSQIHYNGRNTRTQHSLQHNKKKSEIVVTIN